MTITSCVDKYRVTRYQRSTTVSLNDWSSIIYNAQFRNVNVKGVAIGSYNTPSNQNIDKDIHEDFLGLYIGT